MKIGVIGSMQYTEKLIEVRDQLNQLGHEAFVTDLAEPFIGKTDEEKEQIKKDQRAYTDPFRRFWKQIQGADAVVAVNIDKNGVKNYIGGNTFLELGFAHVLDQKIFLLNPIPKIKFYQSEIEAMKPVILNGDLTKIPLT